MLKHLSVVIVGCFCLNLAFAETCPRIDEIKNHHLHGWKIADSQNGEALSEKRAAKFVSLAKEFALAEWTMDRVSQKSAVHCYYRDQTGSNLEAYLYKNNYVLSENKKYWYEVSGYMHCAAGMEKCPFTDNGKPVTTAQLAKTKPAKV